jgi:DNA-binding transcriptional regulator YhcF (GntR family)
MTAASRATLQLELPLHLERSVAPLHLQIAEQLRHAIQEGLLTPGTRLPATRSVAATLSIACNSVMQVYEEIISEGYLVRRTSSGTYVEQSLPDFSRPRLPASVSTPALPRWLHKGERPAGEEAFGDRRSREPSCSGWAHRPLNLSRRRSGSASGSG